MNAAEVARAENYSGNSETSDFHQRLSAMSHDEQVYRRPNSEQACLVSRPDRIENRLWPQLPSLATLMCRTQACRSSVRIAGCGRSGSWIPTRANASRYDLEVPLEPIDVSVDYAARARQLGIHLFPSSNYPFVICVGALFLALAAIPFSGTVRLALLVIGGLIFLYGVVGWVLVEDVRMFPADSSESHGEVHH
jgi:hypothetical protein